jgi:hypothetical protein
LQEHVSTTPVAFWVSLPKTLYRPVLFLSIEGVNKDTVYVQSLDINSHEITVPSAPADYKPVELTEDKPLEFVTPPPPSTPSTGVDWLDTEDPVNAHIDKVAGNYAFPGSAGESYVVARLAYAGDQESPPVFRLVLKVPGYPDEMLALRPADEFTERLKTTDPYALKIPLRDVRTSGIDVKSNVVRYNELTPVSDKDDDFVVAQDYNRFHPMEPFRELSTADMSIGNNLLYNTVTFNDVKSFDKQYLADAFSDEGSTAAAVDPLVVDDSGRGYGLHPQVAETVQELKLGIKDLGSNGLDLWSRAGVDGFDWATYGGSLDPASAARATPAGYTWDADQSQHVVYRDAEGHIRQLYYKAEEQVWRETDLTADTGASIAASSPAAYSWDVDPSQHVVYRDEAGHIQELFFRAEDGVFVNNDLTTATDAPLASGTPSGYTWDADKSQHVVYRAIDGHIVELYYLASQQVWKANDLTEQAARQAGSTPPLAAGSPFGYVWDVDGAQHVVYRGVDKHIHEFVRPPDRDAWYSFDLTKTAAAPEAEGDPVGYTWADDASQHIVYRDTDGHIQQLYYKAEEAVWKHTDLTRDTEAPLAAGSPDAYTWDEDASQHVVYRDRDGRIQELYFKAEEGIWRVNDLSSVTGAPFAQGKPAGYSWDVDPSQHIGYASREGRVEELFFRAESGEWLAAELAPSPYLLPSWDEKAPLDTSDYERFAGVGAAELVLDAGADARIVFDNEVAALDSVLGAYLIAPDGRIGPVGIVFPEIEHRDADPRYDARVRPGGGPLAEGDSVLLSEVFPDLDLAPGQAFGLFLAAGAAGRYGSALFESEAGSFRFVDKSGGEARLTSIDPDLLFTAADGSRIVIESPIFHTAQRPLLADPTTNPLNDGGRTQVLSGRSAQGDLELHFEDLPYSGADRDFNDLIVTVQIA